MSPLYTNGTTPATEKQVRDEAQAFSKAAVNSWITANMTLLKAVVAAGHITIEAETDASLVGDHVRVAFNIAGTTGDRKRLLKMAAAVLKDFRFHAKDLGSDTYQVEKSHAKSWAEWVEASL